MNTLQKATRVFAFLALVFILVGCSTPTVVVPPTPDIPQIRTESVQTVVAKLTIEAALNPTPTAAFTETPAPPPATPTQEPTATVAATLPPTFTPFPTTRPATGGGGGVVYPTATRRAGPDQAQFISQEPKDGTVYKPGEEFDAKWTFKNIGTTTWSTDYDYRFSDGTNLSPVEYYPMPKQVAPGESVTLVADMVAPTDAGRHVSYWEVINGNGDVFFQFYVVIDVR